MPVSSQGDRRPHAAHAAPILYKTFEPGSPFDAFIENVWYWRGSDPGHAKTRSWHRAAWGCSSI